MAADIGSMIRPNIKIRPTRLPSTIAQVSPTSIAKVKAAITITIATIPDTILCTKDPKGI
jgi:hypothetical protein